MIVAKFGGSSLADAAQFRRVRDIVLADSRRQVVVPSAPGKRFPQDEKVTDLFYQCHKARQKGEPFQPVLEVIRGRYGEIAENLGLALDLDGIFQQIWEQIARGAGPDYCASRGEFVNGQLLAEYLEFSFLDAAQAIVFDDDGKLDEEETNSLLQQELLERVPVVLPGFYGRGPQGQIKVCSRGGSDVTGALAARAVGAEVYENWTDVSGFLIADPRIIDHPEAIETITYRELRELAYMGATVLHEDAIFPVRQEGIPINIRNTNAPEDNGTWIVGSTCQKSKYVITGIAGKKGFCSVNIEKDMMNSEIGFGRKVLQAFEENGISFEHVPSGIDTMTVFVHQDEFMHKEQKVVAGIHRLANPDTIDIESDLALIAVVGRGMKSTRGTAGRIFSALAHKNINVKMIDQGSSELNIIIGVANEDFETAIQAIYDIFVITRL